MDEFTSSNTAWLGGFFCITSLWTIDMMFNSMRISLHSCFAAPEKNAIAVEDTDQVQFDDNSGMELPAIKKSRRASKFTTRERSLAALE